MEVLKKILIIKIIFLIILYLCFYIGLPYFLNKKDYSKLLTESIKKETGLVLIIHKYKLSVSPSLAINFKADDIQLFYPDKKQILNIRNANVNISTLYLLFKEIKINKIKSDEIQFSTKLLKSGKTTFQEYIETHIPDSNRNNKYRFSQKMPVVDVKKYIIKIKDEESGQKFKILGNSFKIKQNINPHDIDLITGGCFYCLNKKYVDYNLKISIPKILFKDLNKKLFDISADNLYKYNFYANLTADLKVHEKNQKFDSLSGKANIDKFVIQIGTKKLPPSYFHIQLNKDKALLSSKFYTNPNESTDIIANIKMKKPYEIDMKCFCKKADISNLQQLSISLLEILKIKNNLAEFTTNGSLSADFNLKTNLKTIKSNGVLNLKNASLSHKKIPLKISETNALIDFSNDEINIKECFAKINSQPVKLTGTIDKTAYGNLILSAQNLDLNHIMNAFEVLKPQKNMTVTSGKLFLNIKLQGKLDKAKPQIDAKILNFSGLETINKVKISIKEIFVSATSVKENYSGKVKINNLLLRQKDIPNQSNSIKSQNITAEFDKDNILIHPSKINLGNAKITLKGEVKNYFNRPETILDAGGTVDTLLLKSFVPMEYKNKIYSKGYLPVKIILKNTEKVSEAELYILSNKDNYLTAVHINNFSATNMLTKISAKLENEDITIKDLSLYYAPDLNSLIKKPDCSTFKKAITLNGKIRHAFTKPSFENIHILISEHITAALPDLKNSQVDITADLLLNGDMKKPVLTGNLNITNLSIPQYLINIKSAIFNFNKNTITAHITNIKVKSMDISTDFIAPSDFLKTQKINYLKLSSNYLDINYLMELMPLMKQAAYSPGIEFPYVISSGKIYIKTCKIGDLKASNVTGDLSSQKNILYIKNMFADTYGGKTAGKITCNLPYSSIKAELQGRNLDAASAAMAILPKQQQISGKLNFDASLDMIGTTIQQQMKNMKGRANVLINNGHLGQLGRFEHFLYAQNLLSQRLIYASLNSAKQAIKPKDTGYITYLKGILNFRNGYVHLSPVTTAGPQMSMYITGNINMLNNEADLEILGKISSEVSSSMGILGRMTIKEFLDEHTNYGQTIANLFNFCNSELPEMDISKIPELNPDYKYQTKNFRVVIAGDTESVKAVKSFTWINPIGTKQKILKEKINQTLNSVLPQNNNTTTKQPTIPEAKHNTNITIESKPVQNNQSTQPSFLDNIPDTFK
ncbi:MAG: hypothetical protein KHX03_07620 [Clostridium sp.]|nr:hypothetical protein [Clostridium sp.]